MNYEVGQYVVLTGTYLYGMKKFLLGDARYGMNGATAYRIVNVEDDDCLIIFNPHNNRNSFFDNDDIHKIVNINDNPEYFL